MPIKRYKNLLFPIIAPFFLLGALFVLTGSVRAGFVSEQKFALSDNVGWLNASTTAERLVVSAKGITGYMWGENVGWIKFDHDGVPGADNTSSTTWGVVNDGQGNLSGYAWGENIGWINFNPSHSQVLIDPDTGEFSGYAWGENIGWINFGHAYSDYVMTHQGPPWATTGDMDGGTADMGAYAAKAGGGDISARGFSYYPADCPSQAATSTESGTFSSQSYSLSLELYCDTDYYVRAYAVNAEGTGYGDYKTVRLSESAGSGAGLVFEGVFGLEGIFGFESASGGGGGTEGLCINDTLICD